MSQTRPTIKIATLAAGGPRLARHSKRPESSAELASWPTQLVATSEGNVCAVHIPAQRGWPTVALLHGWAMNRSAWADVALPLADAGFGLLIPDLPGHGDTPDLHGDLGDRAGDYFLRMATQLDEAAAALGLAQLSVAGYSMGAMVALAWSRIGREPVDEQITRQRPNRVQKLMLLDPMVRVPALQMLLNPRSHAGFYSKMARAFTAPNSKMPFVFAALTLCALPLPTRVRKPAIDALMTRSGFGTNSVYESYVDEPHETDVDAFLAGLERTDRRAIMRCFEAKNRSDFMADLLAFRGPLTLLTAEDDPFCPPTWLANVTKKARKAGVSARMTVIDDCDHLTICHRPAAVAAAMAVWLERPQ